VTELKAAWDDVAESVTQVGHRLKTHFDDVVAERPADRSGLDAALGQLRASLDRAYSAAGHAVKDPAVRGDVTKAGASFVDALSTTLTELGERLKARGKDGKEK
jgi:hypothetical protein